MYIYSNELQLLTYELIVW